MDTANYGGVIGKIPRELQLDEATQNSESVNQTPEDSNEAKIDLNWNIAEQLPEDGNCRAEFEAIVKLFTDCYIDTSSSIESLNGITFHSFEIVQRLHKGFAPGKVSPATYFCNALIKVLSNISGIDDEVSASYLVAL